jgi:hypothetical protein
MLVGHLVYHFKRKYNYSNDEIYFEPVLVINYNLGYYEVISNGVKKILKTVDVLTEDELNFQTAKLIPQIPDYLK